MLATIALEAQSSDALQKFAAEFWQWRAAEQPFSQDDIPRIDHPPGMRDWSAKALSGKRREAESFKQRWRALADSSLPVRDQVDYRLLGSALARVHWELNILNRPERDPTFYVDQSMTALLEALLEPPPFNAVRTATVLERLQNIPSIFAAGRENLHAARPFAELAIGELADIRNDLQSSITTLLPLLTDSSQPKFREALRKALDSAEGFREWLKRNLSSMPEKTAVGRKEYEFFLRGIALIPYTPEELIAMSRQEWARSLAFETFEAHRDVGVPDLVSAKSFAEQQKREVEAELAMRRYLSSKKILSVPPSVQHYTLRPIPEYLAPLERFGELDDFTSPARLQQSAVRWTPNPSPQLGFFALATNKDVRPILVHEGIPGHYLQLAWSWQNPDPIRRHYYDSNSNEGIGFYAEEMMLQAGLFDDSPRTRQIIYSFMRLRALRVEVDVKLALGEFSIEQAARYLEQMVPMDSKTAHEEAQLFASTPGQAISYQVGKLQIMQFLAEARKRLGDKFDLQAFHDSLWSNGNVPIALQQWEYLGEESSVPRSSGF